MKRLVCQLVEYYLALCEDDIERSLPGWARRHVQACAHCQAEVQDYRRVREAVRQYARLLPDSPPEGWRPLQVGREVKQRAFPLQLALAPVAVVVVAALGFAVWQKNASPTGDAEAPSQIAQNVFPPQQSAVLDKKPAAPAATPSTKDRNPKQQPKQPASPAQSKPAHQAPPAYHPPRHTVIAAQPNQQNAPATDSESAAEPSPEPPVPVQPVVVEAHPVTSAPVPEGYVIEAAYPATAGAVE